MDCLQAAALLLRTSFCDVKCCVQVYPVIGFPDPAVVGAAQRLVSEHQAKYSQTSRILQQVRGRQRFWSEQRLLCFSNTLCSLSLSLSLFSVPVPVLCLCPQRQTIELIPVTKVTYLWKGKSHIYFVYGNEFKVHADNYPATCCCSVM